MQPYLTFWDQKIYPYGQVILFITEDNTVNSLYSGHCKDLELVSSIIARVCNSREIISVKFIFAKDFALSVLLACPL